LKPASVSIDQTMMWKVLAFVFINGHAKLFAAFSAATANIAD
jgi:hypothetical protein